MSEGRELGLLPEAGPVTREDAEPGGVHEGPVCCPGLPTVSYLGAVLTLVQPKRRRVEGTVGKWLSAELRRAKRKIPSRDPEKSRRGSGAKGRRAACLPS